MKYDLSYFSILEKNVGTKEIRLEKKLDYYNETR